MNLFTTIGLLCLILGMVLAFHKHEVRGLVAVISAQASQSKELRSAIDAHNKKMSRIIRVQSILFVGMALCLYMGKEGTHIAQYLTR